MTRSPTRDFVVGLFVLAGFAALAYLSLSVGGLTFNRPKGLVVFAKFDQIGGLKAHSPVTIAGVKVGQVDGIQLDKNFRARVRLDLDRRLELPIDTTASILTSGLLGDQYIGLQIGGEEQVLKSGDEITFTESAVILERLLGQFIHSTNVNDGGSGGDTGGNGGAPPAGGAADKNGGGDKDGTAMKPQ